MHAVAPLFPSVEVPAGHTLASTSPTVSQYMPAGQPVHADRDAAPTNELNEPFGQSEHIDDPTCAYEPRAHREHDVEPCKDTDPSSQREQLVEEFA